MIGRMRYIIEQFCVTRVMRQYGRRQGWTDDVTVYARIRGEVADWGAQLTYEDAV